MDIIISNASNKPIYEQIVDQVKTLVLKGDLAEGEKLPSIRALANGLQISVITTKRAYAELENQGFIETVQGKGTFVAGGNAEFLHEQQLREVENTLATAVRQAKDANLSGKELHDLLDLLLDE